MTDFLDLLLQPCKLLRLIHHELKLVHQEVRSMNENLTDIAREVGESETKTDELIAGMGRVVADLASVKAELEALRNAPNQQELIDSLSARLDAMQSREQAAIDALNPAPAPDA